MVMVASHLSSDGLEYRRAQCTRATEARHFQTIVLLAKGHTISYVAEAVGFGERWVEELLARYNAQGPASLGDLRRNNGSPARIVTAEVIAKLCERLKTPPADGGLWNGVKAAAWLAGELGVEKLARQRGWEALRAAGYSIQTPRPKNPKSATPETTAQFKKNSMRRFKRKPTSIRAGASTSSQRTSIA